MKTVIICRPDREAIELANRNIQHYLFREFINIDNASEQHFKLKSVLRKNSQQYIDIYDYIPKGTAVDLYTNIIFTRDVFIKTLKGVIIGRMKESVRHHEIQLIKYILGKLSVEPIYECHDNEILEGGDYCQHSGISFIATGTRTNMSAVKKLIEKDLFGTDKIAVVYPVYQDNDMHRIHLDCYFSAFGYKQCVLWEELIRMDSNFERKVIEYIRQPDGTYQQQEHHKRLYEYLIDNRYDVIPLSTESHYNYGCNILELHNGTILVQDEESHKKIKNSVLVKFDEIHNMYGGIHCATNMI
jgi:arginine deiminase